MRITLIPLLAVLPLWGQARDSLIHVGNWGGICHAVAPFTSGGRNLAAVGHGGRLVIADMHDPASPREIGAVFVDGYVRDVWISGNLAYVAAGQGGLRVVDVGIPSQPRTRATLSFAALGEDFWGTVGDYRGSARSITGAGSMVYAGEHMGPVYLIDVSDPDRPRRVSWSYDSLDTPLSLAHVGGYVYQGNEMEGFKVIDVRDPAKPVAREFPLAPGVYPNAFIGGGVAVSGARAYIGHNQGGLKVLDVSSPLSPRILGNLEDRPNVIAPPMINALALRGTLAYLTAGREGLRIVDVSVDSAPSLKKELDLPGEGRDIALVPGLERAYYAADDSGLHVIDIAEPAAPARPGWLRLPATANDIAAAGGRAFVTFGYDGLAVFDLAKPESPARLGELALPGHADGVAAAGNRVYVASPDAFHVIDVSDPAKPAKLGTCALPKDPYRSLCAGCDIALNGDYAYVAHGDKGLMVVDIADPARPVLRDSVPALKTPASLALEGKTLYVAGGYLGLHIAGLENPAKPALDTTLKKAYPVRSVLFEGGRAYVLDEKTLWIYNPAERRRPALLGVYSWGQGFTLGAGLAVKGNYAVVAERSMATLLDVGDPARVAYRSNTIINGELRRLLWVPGTAPGGDLMLATSYRMGFHVFRPAKDPVVAMRRALPPRGGRAAAAAKAVTPAWKRGKRLFDSGGRALEP